MSSAGERLIRSATQAKEMVATMSMEPLGHISEYGLEKLRTRRNYCVTVSYLPEKEFTIGIVRLSDAEERIAELAAENARHLAEIDRKSSMPGDYRYWEGRYRDAEALLKEARKALEPFANFVKLEDRQFPKTFQPENDDKEINNAQFDELPLRGWLRAARSIHDKIGARDE